MDPATINAFIQLVSLGISTFQQYTNGNIDAATATKMFNAASDNLSQAIDVFNKAKDPNEG